MESNPSLISLQSSAREILPSLEAFTKDVIGEVEKLYSELRGPITPLIFKRFASLIDGLTIIINLSQRLSLWLSRENDPSSDRIGAPPPDHTAHLAGASSPDVSELTNAKMLHRWELLITEMLQAQERGDWVRLADLLQFEMLPQLVRQQELYRQWRQI